MENSEEEEERKSIRTLNCRIWLCKFFNQIGEILRRKMSFEIWREGVWDREREWVIGQRERERETETEKNYIYQDKKRCTTCDCTNYK